MNKLTLLVVSGKIGCSMPTRAILPIVGIDIMFLDPVVLHRAEGGAGGDRRAR